MSKFEDADQYPDWLREGDQVIKILIKAYMDEKNDEHIGYSDGVDTNCCELTTSWFVWIPVWDDYDGYFHKSDLTIIENMHPDDNIDIW